MSISDYVRHRFDLQVKCCACGHVGVIDARALLTRCSGSGRMGREMVFVIRRLRCGKCEAKDVICGPTERIK